MPQMGATPHFILRVVGGAKTALEQQAREAVRIRRRGGEGAILNSKGEFNRSYILRLQLEEQTIVEQLEKEEEEKQEEVARELDAHLSNWQREKTIVRREQQVNILREQRGKMRSLHGKRDKGASEMDNGKGSRSKKRRFALVKPGWGEQEDNLLLNTKEEQPTGQ